MVLLSLAGNGLPKGWAQLDFTGGYVQTRREDRTHHSHKARSPSRSTLPTHSPDNDFLYTPAFRSRTDTSSRLSYYPEMPSSPAAGNTVFLSPRKYTLQAAPLACLGPAALLVVHLPTNAGLWVEGKRIRLQGPTSYFRSPPLSPGKKYDYHIRAAWIEEDHWVSLSREVVVAAGQGQTVSLQAAPASGEQK